MRAAVDGAPSCALKTRDERNTCRDKFGKIDDRVRVGRDAMMILAQIPERKA